MQYMRRTSVPAGCETDLQEKKPHIQPFGAEDFQHALASWKHGQSSKIWNCTKVPGIKSFALALALRHVSKVTDRNRSCSCRTAGPQAIPVDLAMRLQRKTVFKRSDHSDWTERTPHLSEFSGKVSPADEDSPLPHRSLRSGLCNASRPEGHMEILTLHACKYCLFNPVATGICRYALTSRTSHMRSQHLKVG